MYQVWQVYGDKGMCIRFYIVNLESKQVQSVWKSYLEAKAVCDKLNQVSKTA